MWATLEKEVKREWVEALGGISKGSRNGYEFNKARRHLRLDRVPYSPLPYPADYGLILNTRGGGRGCPHSRP